MNKSAVFKNVLAAACAYALFAGPAKASIIADWTFPSSGTPTAPVNATSSSETAGTPTLGGSIFGAIASGGGTEVYTSSGGMGVLSFSYTGLNANDVNGQTLTLTLTASRNMTISGLTYSTLYNNAFVLLPFTQTWTYATSSGGSGNVGTVTLNDGNLTSESLSPSISLNAGQTITFTDTFGGAINLIGGTVDFGDISITAVPEPVTWALIGFGVMLAACGALRRIGPVHPLGFRA